MNGEITRQALMIAYVDDFKLMLIITLCAAPLLLLLRHRPMARASGPVGGCGDGGIDQPAIGDRRPCRSSKIRTRLRPFALAS